MSGAGPTYLLRRNGIFHLRVRVPDDVKGLIGLQEISRSLQTYDPRKARLVVRSCEGSRCQSANDLRTITLHAPELTPFKSELCEAAFGDLIAVALDRNRDLAERAVAVTLATGQDCGSEAPVHIRPDPTALFDAFEAVGHFGHVMAVYAQAYRATGLVLAPLSTCLWSDDSDLQLIANEDDPAPPFGWIGDIPTFALDQYTRCGKNAIHTYVSRSTDWRAFAQNIELPRSHWSDAAGDLQA